MRTKDLAYMAMYTALYIAIEYMSNMFSLFSMPQGGSLNLGIIILILASYHLGFWKSFGIAIMGVTIGHIAGYDTFQTIPTRWFWVQVLVDYYLSFGAYAIAGAIPTTTFHSRKATAFATVLVGILGVIMVYGKLTSADWITFEDSFSNNSIWLLIALDFVVLAVLFTSFIQLRTQPQVNILWGILLANILRYTFHNISGWIFYSEYYTGNLLWGVLGYNAIYMIPNLIYSYLLVSLLYPRLKRVMRKGS